MKKISRLFIFLFITPLFVEAQNPLINPSFETWTWLDVAQNIEYPNNWSGDPGPFPCKSTDACEGNYSVLLTDSVYGVSFAAGVAINQTVNFYGINPIGISFCYKYKSTPNDTAFFYATLSDYSNYTSTVYKGFNLNVGTWTQVVLYFSTYSGVANAFFDLNVVALCANTIHVSPDYSQFKIDDIKLVYAATGINDINESLNSMSIYPNPSNGLFRVKADNNSDINSIKIFNILGELIYSMTDSKPQSEYEINLSGYSKGVYFVKVYDGKKLQSKRIVIQ